MRYAVALVLATACSVGEPAPLPPLYVTYDGEYFSDFRRAAELWSPLGFETTEVDPGMPACKFGWTISHGPGCQFTITVVTVPTLIESTGSDAAANRIQRLVYLDESVWTERHPSIYMRYVVAHMMGHIILNTHLHTSEGLMSEMPTIEMSAEDVELACAEIGICS